VNAVKPERLLPVIIHFLKISIAYTIHAYFITNSPRALALPSSKGHGKTKETSIDVYL
jgi:hypothetical protein